MPPSEDPRLARISRVARVLQITAPLLAGLALLYRVTLYKQLPGGAGGEPGSAQLIELALAAALFLVALLCAGSGVAISILGDSRHKGRAYLAFFIGLGSFLLYEFGAPRLAALV